MAKPKALGNMKPRKKTALDPSEAEKSLRGKNWRLNVGTPNEPQEQDQRFLSETLMKKAAVKALRDWEPRCKMFNNAGLAAIDQAVNEISALTTFGREPKIIDCALDEFSFLTIRIILSHY